jgi:DHA1 family multidrug resistance protein-like MFS transporter|uniref:MFS transporter n=1 Tax=Desulfobacca acetoxidans TaxID=60893 RepID=A0A7V6DNK9_9BACT
MTAPSQEPSPRSYRFLIIVCCGLGFASYLTSYMRIPVVPLFAQDLGAGAVMVGLINSAFLLTSGVFSFPFGLLADRWGRKLVVSAGLIVSLVTSVLLAVSTLPWHLLVIYLFFGLGLAAIGPTLMAYVADLSPPSQLGSSYGAYTLAIYTGMSLGPGLGGWVADWLGFRLLFIIAAALVGLVFLLALVYLPSSGHLPHLATAASRPASSWRTLLRHRPLLACWLITLGGCFGLGTFITFAPLYMKAQNLSLRDIGLVFALQAGVNAISRLPCGRLSDWLGRRWLQAIAGFLFLGGSLAAFGLATTLPAFLLATTVLGIAMSLGFTSAGALIAEVVPATDRGLAMGGYNTCIYLGQMTSSALLGLVIGWCGYALSFALSALVVALSTAGFYLLIRDASP